MWATELVYDTLTASRSLTCRWERLLCFLDAAVPLWQRKGIRKGTASFSTTSWQDGETWLRFNLSLRLFCVCLVYGKVKHQLLDFSQCKAILWFYFYFYFFAFVYQVFADLIIMVSLLSSVPLSWGTCGMWQIGTWTDSAKPCWSLGFPLSRELLCCILWAHHDKLLIWNIS